MFIVNTKNTTAEAPITPFAKKWSAIEKKQKRNKTLKTKIDSLYKTFQDKVLPQERHFYKLLAQETQHLISFMPRKSLTGWQREELQTWIESNLDTLDTHPFRDAELGIAAREKYAKMLMDCSNKLDDSFMPNEEDLEGMRSLVTEIFGEQEEFTDEILADFIRDPTTFEQYLQEKIQAKQDEDNETQFEDDDEEFSEEAGEQYGQFGYDGNFNDYFTQQHSQKQAEQKSKLKSLFDTSKLNKLYKILANRLHPDKEINAHLKEEKSKLMAQLVTAKKNKDAFTIISMFYKFVPESELTLFDGSDEELAAALLALLNEKISELDLENQDIKYNNGLQSMIWQKLGARGKKNIDKNIDIHIADLEDCHTALRYIIDEVKTVKALKKILSERYDERIFNPFSELNGMLIEDLDDLFR